MTTVEAQLLADRIVAEVKIAGTIFEGRRQERLWLTMPLVDLRDLIARVLEESA